MHYNMRRSHKFLRGDLQVGALFATGLASEISACEKQTSNGRG